MIDVHRKKALPVHPDLVRQLAGGFDQIGAWHPAVADCKTSETPSGTARHLTLPDGAILQEIRTDDGTVPGTYSYRILSGPLPVRDYTSTFRILATGNGCEVEWSGRFDAEGASEEEARSVIAGIYETGLQALAAMVAGQSGKTLQRRKPSPLPQVTTVSEIRADEALRAVYEDTKAVLQVPWMGVVTMAFAQYPNFYAALWGGLRDLAGSREFVAACAELRSCAEQEVAAFSVPEITRDLRKRGYADQEIERIRDEIEVFSHGNMPYLLIATTARLLIESHDLGENSTISAHDGEHGPQRLGAPVLMEMHHVDSQTRDVYDDIMRTLGLPFVNTDYRALARWPSYFRLAWNALRPQIETTDYDKACERVHDCAVDLARTLPNPGGLTPEILQAAIARDTNAQPVGDVVRLFQWLLPGLIVNVEAFRQQMISEKSN